MTIRSLLIRMFISTSVLISTLVIVTLMLNYQLDTVEEIEERRFRSQALATELIASSEALTTFARNYVVTGDERYRRYYHLTLDIRNGLYKAPKESISVYWQLVLAGERSEPTETDDGNASLEKRMLASGFTMEEFALLKDAQGRSDALAKLEEKAMDELARGKSASASDNMSIASQDGAVALLYSPEYYETKASIMEPIALFVSAMDKRTLNERNIAMDRADYLVKFLMFICVLLLAMLSVVTVQLQRRLVRRGANLLRTVERISAGDLGARTGEKGTDEVALLAIAFDAMTDRLEETLNRAVNQAHELDEQRAQSENLLHNILPVHIADRLKNGEVSIAETFAEVTVLFVDIVGFTKLSASMPAQMIVDILNNLFGIFDEMAKQHGLEKIKTIGDCYMVVGGVPVRSSTHCQQVARFALAALRAIDQYNVRTGQMLQVRMGIHTGTVVAGIVGRQKYSYDLWGDVVNTASRLENTSLPGRIHVANTVHARLLDDFELEQRGLVEIKGMGPIETFFLNGEKAQWNPALPQNSKDGM